MYVLFKTLHVYGAILLVGNVTVTAVWKTFADLSRNAPVIAFAQRLVTITDWFLTVSGILLIAIGGYGAAYISGLNPLRTWWLILGQALFATSGVIWLGVLIPLQIRLARLASEFRGGGEVSNAYWRASRRWLFWGIVATFPLLGAVYVMVAKP